MAKNYPNQKIYAFIDSQNLNLSVKNNLIDKKGKTYYSGWDLDFAKFRIYLKEKYNVKIAYLFIGFIKGKDSLYKALQEAGYILILKSTLTRKEEGKEITKGNVDTELVLHTSAIEYHNYDKAIVVSGDGDFLCLYEFLEKNNKLLKIIIPNKFSYSSLLRQYSEYFDFVSDKRKFLKRKKIVDITNRRNN